MSIVYLNGQFMPMEQASISPLDRGFLFGDGIYEVIPCFDAQPVGFALHIQRMQDGLSELGIKVPLTLAQWQEIVEQLLEANGKGNLGVYLHVSRGMQPKRNHAYPEDATPTVFGFAFDIGQAPSSDPKQVRTFRAVTEQDQRWRRCHIKSTALLGNIMHYHQGQQRGADEVLLFNEQQQLTEAAACNVFVVKDKVIATPVLDHQILPGITRHILLAILRQDGGFTVEERAISLAEVQNADELWLTSSSKEVAPIVSLNGQAVGGGQPGPVWEQVQQLFTAHKYEY
ncbi:aminotransferase class IV [Bowmanella pacifica]|uniref:Aminodeoxychorismate lyase n=1 Tax=Bowmanella pacifica TaxID=502051 RepID=A0A917YZF3_9ALTE|nr:aminotransferase class IV [Bowmanella pacifica]GGO70745.1 cytochrome c550 [Bowmanella pacifica]